jgi:hypothetical protein
MEIENEQDIRNMLKETLELTKENHFMLKKLRSAQKRASFFRAFYWLAIIGISLGAYYYIQPYVNTLIKIYTGGVSGFKNVQDLGKSIPDAKYLTDILSQIQNGKMPAQQ